jgi:hypothetical protein
MPLSNATPLGPLVNRFAGIRRDIVERREHDTAMLDARIAAEHALADTRATSSGEPGCRFCRGSRR